MTVGCLKDSTQSGQCFWLNGGGLSHETAGSTVPSKASLERSVAVEAQNRNRVSGGEGGQETKMKEPCGRESSLSASWQEVKWIRRWLWRYKWGLPLHQGVGDKDDAIEFGKSEKKVYERNQHHV
jgi:hypothetical protein